MQRIFVILALGTMLLLMGNAPAPYYACQGKAAGDACTYGYGGSACSTNRGVCTISSSSGWRGISLSSITITCPRTFINS